MAAAGTAKPGVIAAASNASGASKALLTMTQGMTPVWLVVDPTILRIATFPGRAVWAARVAATSGITTSMIRRLTILQPELREENLLWAIG
jgi:hypothetical protein